MAESDDASRKPGAAPEAWYRLTGEDALARLGSAREGLADEEAARRLVIHGPNALADIGARFAGRSI